MIFFPDGLIEEWIRDDVENGDLTTSAMEIGHKKGEMSFSARGKIRTSGIYPSLKVLDKLGIRLIEAREDGENLQEGDCLISCAGKAEKLHLAWKIVQNILEWSCGVSSYMYEMSEKAKKNNPHVKIACTRKNIPGTKLLATYAIMNGGGIIHRAGTAETILVFKNHRNFLKEPDNWKNMIQDLKIKSPEKKIMLEADNMEEARLAMEANPDILQLDKFSLDEIKVLQKELARSEKNIMLTAAGGINKNNVADFSALGLKVLVSSAPYYAKPADIGVVLKAV